MPYECFQRKTLETLINKSLLPEWGWGSDKQMKSRRIA
jgi:hypothetical protein